MKNTILSIILGLSVLISFPAYAEDKTVIVSGSSAISHEDAVRQAQRLAVEEAVGVFVQSKTEVENFLLKKDKIISKSKGYIKRFKVIEEKKSGSEFMVSLEATVSLDMIKDDLIAMKILLESMERPKLMVLIEEDYKSMDDIGMLIAATELSAQLGKKGFELVDKAQVEAVQNIDQKQQALAGNDAAAASLALSFGAQYVIVGKAVAQDAGEAFPGSGLKSIQVSLQLKVIQSQTASILGSTVQTGVSAHMSPLTGATLAFQGAVSKAVDEYLVDAITNSFQDFLNNGSPLKLHITGVTSFRESKDLSDAVDNLSRVASSKKEGWNKAGGLLKLDLLFKGTSEELADLLDGMQFGEKKLMVVDLAPERLNCSLQ